MRKDNYIIKPGRNTIIGLTGLALLVGSIFVASSIKNGFKETAKSFNDGSYSASLNYGGKVFR